LTGDMVGTAQQNSFPRFGGREGRRCGSDRSALSRVPPERMCRNTRKVPVSIGASVISTGGRNLRSLTSVRDDNPVARNATQSFREGRKFLGLADKKVDSSLDSLVQYGCSS